MFTYFLGFDMKILVPEIGIFGMAITSHSIPRDVNY